MTKIIKISSDIAALLEQSDAALVVSSPKPGVILSVYCSQGFCEALNLSIGAEQPTKLKIQPNLNVEPSNVEQILEYNQDLLEVIKNRFDRDASSTAAQEKEPQTTRLFELGDRVL